MKFNISGTFSIFAYYYYLYLMTLYCRFLAIMPQKSELQHFCEKAGCKDRKISEPRYWRKLLTHIYGFYDNIIWKYMFPEERQSILESKRTSGLATRFLEITCDCTKGKSKDGNGTPHGEYLWPDAGEQYKKSGFKYSKNKIEYVLLCTIISSANSLK